MLKENFFVCYVLRYIKKTNMNNLVLNKILSKYSILIIYSSAFLKNRHIFEHITLKINNREQYASTKHMKNGHTNEY